MTTKPQSQNQAVDLFGNGYTPALPDKAQLLEIFKRIADFITRTRKPVDPKFMEKTPDGKADTLVISYVENRLDELYSGLWSTTNFNFQIIANELAGRITLRVFHPECGVWIEREGTAAVQIMVDRCPENITGVDRNRWALNLENKKANALQTGIGKLKAECLKNAAKSLGLTFGRELNRKKSDTSFNPDVYDSDTVDIRDEIMTLVNTCTLPQPQKDAMIKLAQNTDTSITRLMGMIEILKENQGK